MAQETPSCRNTAKGDNSVIIHGRDMTPVRCTFARCPLQVCELSFEYLQWFSSYAQDKSVTDRQMGRQTDGQSGDYMLSLWEA